MRGKREKDAAAENDMNIVKGEKDTVHLYAKTLGVSREGMRYFEQKRILHPEKDEKTGYRIYGGRESLAIIACKKYRRFGLGIDEISRLFHQRSDEETIGSFEERYAQAERRIEEERRILGAMRARLDLLKESAGAPSVVVRPHLYWMQSRVDMTVTAEERAVKQMAYWNRRLSAYADPAIIWTKDKLLGCGGHIYGGQTIEAEYAEGYDLGDVREAPPAKCLCAVEEFDDYGVMSRTLFANMLSMMREKGLAPAGDGIARQLRLYYDEKDRCHFIWQLFIPIE